MCAGKPQEKSTTPRRRGQLARSLARQRVEWDEAVEDPRIAEKSGEAPASRDMVRRLVESLDCLPIVALQYTISLRSRNFLTPVGFGFMLWIGTLAALSWRWNFLIPYSYTMIEYLKETNSSKVASPAVDIHTMAIGYFLLFTLAGCLRAAPLDVT